MKNKASFPLFKSALVAGAMAAGLLASACEPSSSEEVPRSHEIALEEAQRQVDLEVIGMSKEGIRESLTRDQGAAYSEEAAEYAVENVEADWFAEAVEAAEFDGGNYILSPSGMENRLREWGFTPEEIEHAIEVTNPHGTVN